MAKLLEGLESQTQKISKDLESLDGNYAKIEIQMKDQLKSLSKINNEMTEIYQVTDNIDTIKENLDSLEASLESRIAPPKNSRDNDE